MAVMNPASERSRPSPLVVVATVAVLAAGMMLRSNLVAGFVVLFVIFVPLEKVFALRPQRIFRPGWATDTVHFFVTNLVISGGFIVAFVPVAALVRSGGLASPAAAVHSQPLWVQFLEARLLGELAFYWAHRTTHRSPRLWRFHVIHHAITEMDWLASARQHPVDGIFTRVCATLPLFALGFSRVTFGALVVLQGFEALFIHANTRLRFGPLRWVMPTPEFHQWHHANEPEAINKNFAGGLPLIDLIFGTLYMPKGRYPQRFGVDEEVAQVGYFAEMWWPFRQRPVVSDCP